MCLYRAFFLSRLNRISKISLLLHLYIRDFGEFFRSNQEFWHQLRAAISIHNSASCTRSRIHRPYYAVLATRTVSSRLVLILNWCLSLAPMPWPNCMTGHVRVCITCNSRGLVTSLSTRDPRLHFYWIRHRSGHARAHDTNDKTCR